jgi:tRNA nucleotidyltransferase (CCA-adding enzyme)
MGRKENLTPRWEHFQHVADMGLRGYGATMAEAFVQTALALTAVITDLDQVTPSIPVQVACEGEDQEILLVDWLNAIIYEMATRNMLFSRYAVEMDGARLSGTMWGEEVDVPKHAPAVEVKGATFTALQVRRGENGLWIAQCVVDV